LEYYCFALSAQSQNIQVVCDSFSQTTIAALAFSQHEQKSTSHIVLLLDGREAIGQVSMAGIVGEKGEMALLGSLQSSASAIDSIGSLVQRGIFLDETGKIRCQPILLPGTAQGSLKHSA